MSSASIAVLVTGDPIAPTRATRGDFLEMIRGAAPSHAALPWHSHDARVLDILPDLTDALAVIVTGSPLSVTERAPWMERAAAALRELVQAEVPVLGICFGHQLLGHALGGRVERNPRGREMGSVEFTALEADPVVGGPGAWLVNSTHVDSVVELPPGASIVGSTALDPYAALRFGPLAWGVQFHPELDAEVMRQYIEARRPALIQENFDVESAQRGVCEAPAGAAVIDRFLRVAVESRLRRAS